MRHHLNPNTTWIDSDLLGFWIAVDIGVMIEEISDLRKFPLDVVATASDWGQTDSCR